MKSMTDEKDIGHPFSTMPYPNETLKNLIKHFMALNQHDTMGIQNDLRTKRVTLDSFSYDCANQ